MSEMTLGEKLRAKLDEGYKPSQLNLPHATFIQLNMRVGNYMIWDVKTEPDAFGITYLPTGELGMFKKSEFEPYIAAFFGLNF
jgi:hypothetical protein